MTMQSNKSAQVTMAADAEIANDMHPFLRRYKDGRVERLVSSTFVPASEVPGATGVATRDVVIDPGTGVSVRLFLSAGDVAMGRRLPLIVYFHGGAFCTESAYSKLFHRYAVSLSARAEALVVFAPKRVDLLWPFLTAGISGNDDPRLNPPADEVTSLQCRRALVPVASKDVMRDRGLQYAAWLGHDEWCRQVTLVESEGEDHGFHLYCPARASAVALMDSVAKFINEGAPSPIVHAETELFHYPAMHLHAQVGTNKTCRAASANGSDKNVFGRPRLMARNALVIGSAKPLAPRFGLMLGGSSSSKLVQKGPFAPAALWRTVAKSFL